VLTNLTARGVALQVLLLTCILLVLGPVPLAAFAVQSAFTVFLLEYINSVSYTHLRAHET